MVAFGGFVSRANLIFYRLTYSIEFLNRRFLQDPRRSLGLLTLHSNMQLTHNIKRVYNIENIISYGGVFRFSLSL